MTTKERAKLKSIASNLSDNVFVGKEGVTDNVVQQTEENLYAHEIVKVKVLKNYKDEIKDIADTLATRTESQIVQIIGNKIVLYKVSKKDKIVHLL